MRAWRVRPLVTASIPGHPRFGGADAEAEIDPDALKVDSFEVPTQAEPKGTVYAHVPSYPDPVWTCAYHCTWIGTACET